MSDLLIHRSAVISPCGLYRNRLERNFGEGKTAAIFGVNPSKADGDIDDHTVVKLYGFCARNGIGRYILENKFSFRATDVRELRAAADPIGPDNDRYIEQAMRDADVHIVAWGPLTKLPSNLRNRWRDVAAIAERVGCRLMCFGTAKDGQPRHPLMLAYSTPLIEWKKP